MSRSETVTATGRASSPILERIVNRVFRCSHRRQSRPITLKGETFAVCLDCGERIAYDLEGLRGGTPARGGTLGPKNPRNPTWPPPTRIAPTRRSRIKKSVSPYRKELATGLGIAIGECVFAVNGPFLFNRFALTVPEAAAVGCVVGAAVGYGFADFAFRFRNGRHGVSSVTAVAEAEVKTKRNAARNIFEASAPTNRTGPNAKNPLIETLPVEERIRQRANQLYIERGNRSGSPLEDWLRAQADVLNAHRDALVDEASEESFPASDPPGSLWAP